MRIQIKSNHVRFFKQLRDFLEAPKFAQVSVNFSAEYAYSVHEAKMKLKGKPRASGRGFYWDPQFTATNKFLEKSLDEVADLMKKKNLRPARASRLLAFLYRIGLIVQARSQHKVPVDTGNLKASAYTKVEKVVY